MSFRITCRLDVVEDSSNLFRRGRTILGTMAAATLALAMAMGLDAVAAARPLNRVTTAEGALSGVASAIPGVMAFEGVPYARPPVGPLRWRAPEPAASWTGLRAANRFSASCMQPPARTPPARPGMTDRSDIFLPPASDGFSEDCLYLNVWTPAKTAHDRLPVMVYIHGGGFATGSGHTLVSEGARLAARGVVVVSINYRLGAFGYLAHAELAAEDPHGSSGAYGFLDQIAALRWVQRNIAAFGGDPLKVTIFGGSAGSMSVNVLAASPAAKGLLRGAIGESGAVLGRADALPSAAAAQEIGAKFPKLLGKASILESRAAPASAILEAQVNGGLAFRPSIDGYVLPQDPSAIFAAGRQNDVATIAGWNANEDTILGGRSPPFGGGTAAGFQAAAHERFGPDADAFLKDYPAATDAEAQRSAGLVFSDRSMGLGAAAWTQAQARTGAAPAYLYYFAHPTPVALGVTLFGKTGVELGATHGSEMYYVTNVLADLDWPWTDADRMLARTMQSYWVNFAKTGDPNGPGLPRWAPVRATGTPATLHIADEVAMGPLPRADGMRLLTTKTGDHDGH